MTYDEFLHSKIEVAPVSGFAVKPEEVSPALKPHQRDAVIWACKGGRRALLVLPLGVRQEFTHDAVELLHIDPPVYVRTMAEAEATDAKILMTNYERVRDGGIDPKAFTVAALDEASCLRSYGSETFQVFMEIFKGLKYKLVATATPSPNRHKELIHYAGFLEIMDTGQALTRFFQRDSTKSGNLTLYPHKEEEFWLWLSSWALEQVDAISKEFMTVPPASTCPDVWDDISRMKTLNTTQSQRRKQLHVCPLQLDIVERIIERYSNPGDWVFDPFAGLATVPMMAVRMGRKGYGCELNADYFADGVGYLRAEEAEVEQPSLFDMITQSNGVMSITE